jgi:hypothetical protein
VYAGALAITTNIAHHRAETRRIPSREGEVSEFYDFSGRSSSAAMRDFQRDPRSMAVARIAASTLPHGDSA